MGSIVVNIVFFWCKINCCGDNLFDNICCWQLLGGNEKEFIYFYNMLV